MLGLSGWLGRDRIDRITFDSARLHVVSLKTDPTATFVSDVCESTAELILVAGLQSVRSAEVARRADTTESRLFRHFDGLSGVLQSTFEWSWKQVVEAVAKGSFTSAAFEPRTALLADLQSLLEMRQDPTQFRAAVLAFTYHRRPEQIAACRRTNPESQDLYVARLNNQCDALINDRFPTLSQMHPEAGVALANRILNYLSSAFFAWFLIPRESEDVFDVIHDLSTDEVLLGANQLIDRFVNQEGIGDERERL